MRRYQSDPDALIDALAARVDDLDRELKRVGTDVTALGHGLAELTAQIRALANGTRTAGGGGAGTARGDIGTAAGGARGPGSTSPDGEEATAQRDWLTVTDPTTAADWLSDLSEWVTAVGTRHGLNLSEPCWVLHPDIVTELLALAAERVDAYDGDDPTAVCEWLSRWLPGATERITTSLAACVADRGHREAGHLYSTRDVDLSPTTVATWWTTDRHLPAPQALALTPVD
ncbi:MAG: hypothetical protein GXX79_03935 [Actinomycetales bacterium]|nr:hypothetical protein [Actinomycetales bacterium]